LTAVKAPQINGPASFEFLDQQTADQVTGDNEKDVDANKATRQALDPEMKQDDREDRERSQPFDVFTELLFQAHGPCGHLFDIASVAACSYLEDARG
jgi:hypothetical protein